MIALLLACGTQAPDPAVEPQAAVHTWLDGKPSTGGGTLMVVEEHAVGVTAAVVPPRSELTLTPRGEPRHETIGDRVVTTQAWSYSGDTGHHEIPPFTVPWTAPDGTTGTASAPSLFVDLGVPPVQAGKLADIADPSPVWTISRGLLAGSLLVGGLVAGGLWVAFRNPKPRGPAPAAAVPPDVAALRAWDAVRKNPELDDLAKASELSRIFREYAEIVLRFPATKWTTSETLTHLQKLEHLPEGNVPRARSLLRATDRVKYAGEGAKAELFEELDADLRAFVATTRPHAWTP
jgi:hypothetical protein